MLRHSTCSATSRMGAHSSEAWFIYLTFRYRDCGALLHCVLIAKWGQAKRTRGPRRRQYGPTGPWTQSMQTSTLTTSWPATCWMRRRTSKLAKRGRWPSTRGRDPPPPPPRARRGPPTTAIHRKRKGRNTRGEQQEATKTSGTGRRLGQHTNQRGGTATPISNSLKFVGPPLGQ